MQALPRAILDLALTHLHVQALPMVRDVDVNVMGVVDGSAHIFASRDDRVDCDGVIRIFYTLDCTGAIITNCCAQGVK
jgi:hypothetical protein